MQSAVNRVSPTPASASAGVLDTLPLFALADYRVPSGPLPMPMFYVIPFLRPVGHARAISANDSASVRFVIPACGLDATHSVNILRAEELGPTLDELKAANPGWHFDGREFAIFITFDDMSDEGFPLGATPRHGALTLTVNGLSSTSSWDFAASPIAYAWSAAVGVDPPFLGANSLGLTAANAIFGQSTVRRVNLGDQPMEGQDVLGSGIQLGAGYVAQAQVVSAHSIADLGGDASPDNQYRGAAVTIQPQSNRFQTTVKWHIGPGDSLQYAITWNLTGPDGQRPLLSMPKRGACDS
jgi:hypothetical protein